MSVQKVLSGSGFAPLQVKNIIGDVDGGETATGSNAAGAYSLFKDTTIFTTVAAGTGSILPPGNTGAASTVAQNDQFTVINLGANPLTVYPPTGGTINGGASISVAANALVYLRNVDTAGLVWISH